MPQDQTKPFSLKMNKSKCSLSVVGLLTAGRESKQGKWIVLFGSSLLMLGSGVALAWSCIAFHLFVAAEGAPKAYPLSYYSTAIWPMLLYAIGALMALPVGSLLDNKVGPRIACILGSCISFTACMFGAFAIRNFWLILLTLGFLNGAGFGLLLFPAGTAAMRWDVKSCNLISTLRGTAFMAGLLIFAPMSIAMMAPKQEIDMQGSGGVAALGATLNPGGFEGALKIMAGLAFVLQVVGAAFVENPPWYSVKAVQGVGQQANRRSDSDNTKEPLLPTHTVEVSVHPLLEGADLRHIYLSHLITPFSLASVSDTAQILQSLFLPPPEPPTWEPAAVGVSLRVRQALQTPRAWVLITIGTLNVSACGILLSFWRMTIMHDTTVRAETSAAFAALFGILTPAFWGAFTASSSAFSAVLLNQFIGALACACAAGAPKGGPGFTAVALALGLAFLVGSSACLPRFVAIAFGPHRLAFLLFGYACICIPLGLGLAGGAAEAALRMHQHGVEVLFASAAAALGGSIIVLISARCYRKRVGRILDLPSAYHLRFDDGESGDEDSEASSDLDFHEPEGDDPTKPQSLSAAVQEYRQQQKQRREFDGPLLASCGGFIQDKSIMHFPAGPLQGAETPRVQINPKL